MDMPQQNMPPQGAPPQGAPEQDDPAVEAQYEQILAPLLDYIFGKGAQVIEGQLDKAKSVGEEIGRITFTLLKEAGEQAKQAQQELDMEAVFGVATELIDSLIRLAQAKKIEVDPDAAREEALLTAVHAYLLMSEANPEEQEIAKQMLAELTQDGTAEEAAGEIQRIGQRVGVDPLQQQQPQQNPMASGIKSGLMRA